MVTKGNNEAHIARPYERTIIERDEANKAEERGMTGKERQDIRQTTIMLPYFDEEVPVLYLDDGTAYLPVRALCRMLGLRAETHIPRWRRLVLWANVRKLPLQTARGERMVWCLHRGALPFWCVCFNWSLVSTGRREQLGRATDAWQEDIAQAQRLLLERYRSLRRFLFTFLDAYSDAEAWLDQWALYLSATLDVATSRQLELLLTKGKTLIDEAMAQAGAMVQEQATAPIIDIVTIDEIGAVTETDTQPLFPVVPREAREQFFTSMRELVQWQREVAAFIDRLTRSQKGDQSEEA